MQSSQDSKFRQLIIVRKDLNMSPGKVASQVAHASMAFLTRYFSGGFTGEDANKVFFSGSMDKDLYYNWFIKGWTKIVCKARNRSNLMRATILAGEVGLTDKDYFLIKDDCSTEIEPEEIGEDGKPKTLTCIGFRPLPEDIAHYISRKFPLY